MSRYVVYIYIFSQDEFQHNLIECRFITVIGANFRGLIKLRSVNKAY